MNQSPPTSLLIRMFARGEQTAFRDLYKRVAPKLYLWCAVRVPAALHRRLDPEDLMQEVWCRALHAFKNYDATRGAFRTWLFGIAARTLAEEFRRLHVRRREGCADGPDAGARKLDELPAELCSVTKQVVQREELHQLLGAVADFDEIERRLFLLRGIEGLPHGEVGARLGISAEATEIRWRRLRARLRRRAQIREIRDLVDS